MTNGLDLRRKRIRFRAVRRGTKESDAILGGFAERHLHALNPGQLDGLEALLDRNDPEILGWLAGTETPPPEIDREILAMLVAFKRGLAPS